MRSWATFLALAVGATSATAQTVARSVLSSDGAVHVLFPARPNVCGDGESYIRTWRGRGVGEVHAGSNVFANRGGWSDRPCVAGQVRVLVSVMSGEIARLSTFVGPVPRAVADVRAINASAADAMAWLSELAQRGNERIASNAMQAMMFADAPAPWPFILRLARDTERGRGVRQHAVRWLASGVTEKLGLADYDENATDDDVMRTQAVFVVSQGRKTESVPELMSLVRTAKNSAVRKAAIFWLGQSGDSRAVDVFAELLRSP